MNKNQLIDEVAEKANMNKTKAKIALNAFLNGISDAFKKQATLKIGDFGTFKVNYRPARVERNPRTGEKSTFLNAISLIFVLEKP